MREDNITKDMLVSVDSICTYEKFNFILGFIFSCYLDSQIFKSISKFFPIVTSLF